MTNDILGYSENVLEFDGGFDYQSRSYKFSPIREAQRGMITTASVMMCTECQGFIKSMGGPGYRCYCLKCYDVLKVRDFAEGHEHHITE